MKKELFTSVVVKLKVNDDVGGPQERVVAELRVDNDVNGCPGKHGERY